MGQCYFAYTVIRVTIRLACWRSGKFALICSFTLSARPSMLLIFKTHSFPDKYYHLYYAFLSSSTFQGKLLEVILNWTENPTYLRKHVVNSKKNWTQYTTCADQGGGKFVCTRTGAWGIADLHSDSHSVGYHTGSCFQR